MISLHHRFLLQLVQGKMADMYTTLSVTRSYVYDVTRALDRGERIPKVKCDGKLVNEMIDF